MAQSCCNPFDIPGHNSGSRRNNLRPVTAWMCKRAPQISICKDLRYLQKEIEQRTTTFHPWAWFSLEDFILGHVIWLNLDIAGVVAERISDLLQHGCVRGLHKSVWAQRFVCTVILAKEIEQRTTSFHPWARYSQLGSWMLSQGVVGFCYPVY